MISAKGKKRRSIKGVIKSVDIYGHPINLTYKNRAEFQSVFGGILTLLFRVIVILYVAF